MLVVRSSPEQRSMAERGVRPDAIVVVPPTLDKHLDFVERRELFSG